MSSPIIPLANRQLPNSATALYTSPTGVWTQIAKVLLVNVDSSSHTATLEVVPNGQSAGSAFITTDAQAILTTQSFNSPNEYGLVLGPGDSLYGFADTGAVVNCFVSGVQTTS